mgnify:CR=1 FL=1
MHDNLPEIKEVLFGLADPIPTEGKTSGYVKIPYSSDLSAYGFIALPIVIIGSGEGPTVLLLAGSQGDEYEGQVALSQIARSLKPETMSGRVIIIPMANAPAANAGLRNSPIDGFNLNRIYPGNVRGRPTAMIASYIENHLMIEADIVIDLHSGGRSQRYTPCATMMDHIDAAERAKRLSLALAFGAPRVLVSQGFENRNSSGAAKRSGAVRIGSEMGGGETLEKELVDMTVSCINNVLVWAGILDRPSDIGSTRDECIVHEVIPVQDYLYAFSDGLFEPAVRLGDVVSVGDLAGSIYDVSRPMLQPSEIRFSTSGTVVCKRAPGLTLRGDCVIHTAKDYKEKFQGEIEKCSSSEWLQTQYRGRRPKVRKKTTGEDRS